MQLYIIIFIMFLFVGCKNSTSNCENISIEKEILETLNRYDLNKELFCNGYNDAASIDSATYIVYGSKIGPFKCESQKMLAIGIKVIFVSPMDRNINSSLEYIMGFNEKMKQKYGVDSADFECND